MQDIEEIKITPIQIENGLEIYYSQMTSLDYSVVAHINSAPMYEDGFTLGISHLVEHMLDRGIKTQNISVDKRKRRIGDEFEWSTTERFTLAELRVAPKHLESGLELLSEELFRSEFSSSDLKKEKEIVCTELAMYDVEPNEELEINIMEFLFGDSPLSRILGGTKKTVETISFPEVKDYYKEFFTPQNTILFITGPGEPEFVKEKIIKYFSKIKRKGKRKNADFQIPQYLPRNIKIPFRSEDLYLETGTLVKPRDHPTGIALRTGINLMNNRLYDITRNQEPYTYDCSINYQHYDPSDTIRLNCFFEVEKYQQFIKMINRELRTLSNGRYSIEDIREATNSRKEAYELALKQTNSRAEMMQEYWIRGAIHLMPDIPSILDSMDPKFIQRCCREYIDEKKFSTVVVGNVK